MQSRGDNVATLEAASKLFLNLVLGITSSLLRGVGAGIELVQNPLPGATNILTDLGQDRLGWRAGSVTEVSVLLAHKGPQLINIRSLRSRLDED